MRPYLLVALALFAIPATAKADIRATYADGSIIEINDDGAFRGNLVCDGQMMLHTEGYNYVILDDGGTPRVIDPVVAASVAEALTPDLIRFISGSVPPAQPFAVGEITVGERKGVGYRIDDAADISFVISADPELNLVGQVIAIQFGNCTQMQGPLGAIVMPLNAIFAEGAAIRFGDVDLVSVEEVEIDDATFALPGKPLDYEATQEVMLRLGIIKAE
ncbi:MAG: hypothetical protein AAFR88_10285 [Pseudomonadota bacterium]